MKELEKELEQDIRTLLQKEQEWKSFGITDRNIFNAMDSKGQFLRGNRRYLKILKKLFKHYYITGEIPWRYVYENEVEGDDLILMGKIYGEFKRE